MENGSNIIDERLGRPIGEPPLNIVEAMNVYNQTIYYGNSNIEDQLDEVHNQIADLRMVEDTDELEKEYSFLKNIYSKDEKKAHFLQEFLCTHPLYGVFEEEAICTICGKRFPFDEYELQELIESKKLIADCVCYDEDIAYPRKIDSLRNIRETYLEYYINSEDKSNVEEQVWDHFCANKKKLKHYRSR